MRENYDICTGNGHKKSHRAKKLAFGRNETPSTPVNQKQQDLDYTEFFQVHPKFPLTTSETLSCAKAALLRIRVLFNNIDCTRSHKFYTVQSSALRRDILSMCDVIHCKRHIVTDIKVTIKILKKGTLALSLSLLWPGIVVRGNSGQKIGDLEISGIVEMKLFFVDRGHWGSIFVECQFFYPVAFFLG